MLTFTLPLSTSQYQEELETALFERRAPNLSKDSKPLRWPLTSVHRGMGMHVSRPCHSEPEQIWVRDTVCCREIETGLFQSVSQVPTFSFVSQEVGRFSLPFYKGFPFSWRETGQKTGGTGVTSYHDKEALFSIAWSEPYIMSDSLPARQRASSSIFIVSESGKLV